MTDRLHFRPSGLGTAVGIAALRRSVPRSIRHRVAAVMSRGLGRSSMLDVMRDDATTLAYRAAFDAAVASGWEVTTLGRVAQTWNPLLESA